MSRILWEYKVFSWDGAVHHMEKWLNDLGAQGWELFGTHPTQKTAYIFKRPLSA